MGTRADFYIQNKKDKSLEWLGSISYDGYELDGLIEKSKTPKTYRKRVLEFLKNRDDATFVDQGWPWPWNNSKLTDETYCFVGNEVLRCYKKVGSYEDNTTPLIFTTFENISKFFNSKKSDEKELGDIKFKNSVSLLMPDMKDKKRVATGKRSGLITVSVSSSGMRVE